MSGGGEQGAIGACFRRRKWLECCRGRKVLADVWNQSMAPGDHPLFRHARTLVGNSCSGPGGMAPHGALSRTRRSKWRQCRRRRLHIRFTYRRRRWFMLFMCRPLIRFVSRPFLGRPTAALRRRSPALYERVAVQLVAEPSECLPRRGRGTSEATHPRANGYGRRQTNPPPPERTACSFGNTRKFMGEGRQLATSATSPSLPTERCDCLIKVAGLQWASTPPHPTSAGALGSHRA